MFHASLEAAEDMKAFFDNPLKRKDLSSRESEGLDSPGKASAGDTEKPVNEKTLVSEELVPEALFYYGAEGYPELEGYVMTLCREYLRLARNATEEEVYRFIRRILLEMKSAKVTLAKDMGMLRFRLTGENIYSWDWISAEGKPVLQGKVKVILKDENKGDFLPPVILAVEEILIKYDLKDEKNVLTAFL